MRWLLGGYERPDKQSGQIQFVRVIFFLLSTDSSAGYQPMLASKRVEYVGKAVKVQM